MHQHLKLQGVARFLPKSDPKWFRDLLFSCALSILLVFSLFLLFSPDFAPLFGQEKGIKRVTAPIQSVFSSPVKVTVPSSFNVNSALPGLGTLRTEPASAEENNQQKNQQGNTSVLSPILAGSLELLPRTPAYIPSIYVEEQGYVPLQHPSIFPHIDPNLLKNPEANPAVVMIPTQNIRQKGTPQMEMSQRSMLSFPAEKVSEPIVISAQNGFCKRIGNDDVFFLFGDCSLRQGKTAAQSPDAVIWVSAERDPITKIKQVTFYLEGKSGQQPIKIEQSPSEQCLEKQNPVGQNDAAQKPTQIADQQWLGHWYTQSAVDVLIANPSVPSQEEPVIFKRALARMNPIPSTEFGGDILQTQFSVSQVPMPGTEESAFGFRSVQLNARGNNGFSATYEPYDPNDQAGGGMVIFTGGINLIIEGIESENVAAGNILSGNTVDISADNAVVWAAKPDNLIRGGGTSFTESESLDFEIYLEGNIIYREGSRVIEANRMYYDAKHHVAYILNAHLSSPISETEDLGTIRLKAEVLRRLGEDLFTAKNTMLTTSRLGVPTYSMRSQSLRFDHRVSPSFADSGNTSRQMIVAENNYVALKEFPIFYWPWMATDAEVPTFYLKNLSTGRSGRNGYTVKTLWDPFQILNFRRPAGVESDLNVTWMEKRGIGHGIDFQYGKPTSAATLHQTQGSFDYWGIHDQGTDKLGGERTGLEFPHSYRYRVHWIHQQRLGWSLPLTDGPWDIRAEVGKTSDRNFLNSYFNSLWHTEENATSAVDLTHRRGNQSFTLSAEYALDNFYSNANWLPKLEHFWLGKSLLNDYLTFYEHTRIGLVDYHAARHIDDTENDPFMYEYLPWEDTPDRTGLAFSTRHELDLPLQTGAMKIVPYVLSEFSAWGEDRTGKSVERFYGQGGVRLNIPLWKVNPRVSSRTWYLNGLAHKINLEAEYFYAEASRSMDNLILTDPIDHWSVDDFRRRYVFTNAYFGETMFEPKFDPRYYALRSGLASHVTAGNMEIADDMQMIRVGMSQRFQTKRGSVSNRHILDWITFSTHLNIYPQSKDNFGKSAGLIDYNILWHVGDRFSLFSEGIYDVFEDGQNLTRFGGVWNRPDRGSFRLMMDQFSGIIEKTYLSMSMGYMMNEKYSMSYMTSYDLRDGQNVGHNFMFVRTGESFRLLTGAMYSEALSEWSFSIGLEPVFLRRHR